MMTRVPWDETVPMLRGIDDAIIVAHHVQFGMDARQCWCKLVDQHYANSASVRSVSAVEMPIYQTGKLMGWYKPSPGSGKVDLIFKGSTLNGTKCTLKLRRYNSAVYNATLHATLKVGTHGKEKLFLRV